MLNDRVNLTDARIKALASDPMGKRRPELRDSQVPGLIVIAHKRHKSFALLARFPKSAKRRPTRRTIGEVGSITIEQARQIARDWTEQLRRGNDPAVEKAAREAAARAQQQAVELAAEGLFKNVAEAYLKRAAVRHRRPHEAERIIRNVLVPAWGDRNICDITRRDVVKLVEQVNDHGGPQSQRPKPGGAPIYAQATFGWARTLFNRGVYGLEHSPCDRIKVADLLTRTKQPRQRVLSDDELRAFWKASGRLGYPWTQMFRLLLLTGTRRGEMAGARWTEFDLGKALFTVPPERFKSNASHLVPLSADALAVVASLPKFKTGDCVFSFTFGKTPALVLHSAKTRLDALMLRYLRALARLRGDDPARVTLPPWVVHDLRRTVRTRLSALEVNDTVAEIMIGHGRRGIQRVYDLHRYEPQMRRGFELWAAHLRGLLRPRRDGDAKVVPLRTGGTRE